MMALRYKLCVVGAIPTALSLATFGLSTTVSGTDAAFLYRLGLTFAIAALLFCIVTWDLHQVGELQQDVTFLEARAAAAERRADANEETVRELAKRLAAIEDDLECRRMVKRMWDREDDEQLRDLLHPEDS